MDLKKAFKKFDYKTVVKLLKKDKDIEYYLNIFIEDYEDKFAKDIIVKFNKYKVACQLALNYINDTIFKFCIKKVGYKDLKLTDRFFDILKNRIRNNNYIIVNYLLDNTTLITKDILTKILCIMATFDNTTDKIINYINKTNFNINLNMLNECALNNANEELINFLIKNGADNFDQEILKNKIIEKQKKELKDKVNQWIGDWTENSSIMDKNVPIEIVNGLKETIKDDNYTIYRGLTWGKDQMNNSININELQIDKFIDMDLKDISSWSTNYKVAQLYSKYKVISQNNDYGIILGLTTDKSHILADLRKEGGEEAYFYFKPGDSDSVSVANQSEIILKPGKYTCQITLIRILDYYVE